MIEIWLKLNDKILAKLIEECVMQWRLFVHSIKMAPMKYSLFKRE